MKTTVSLNVEPMPYPKLQIGSTGIIYLMISRNIGTVLHYPSVNTSESFIWESEDSSDYHIGELITDLDVHYLGDFQGSVCLENN